VTVSAGVPFQRTEQFPARCKESALTISSTQQITQISTSTAPRPTAPPS
jgi:hypothetical protein